MTGAGGQGPDEEMSPCWLSLTQKSSGWLENTTSPAAHQATASLLERAHGEHQPWPTAAQDTKRPVILEAVTPHSIRL
jgi:hypothetical protein